MQFIGILVPENLILSSDSNELSSIRCRNLTKKRENPPELGVCGSLSKSVPCLGPKSAIFPSLFLTFPLHQNPVSDLRYNEFLVRTNVLKGFVDFLFDNDEKVVSS